VRHTYIVTYDIRDPKRLRKVYKLMQGLGEHLQLSVFQCELNARELIELRSELGKLIQFTADQVLFVDVGTVDGRSPDSITALGVAYADPERIAIVV
jgi:CRISPR-associated protein Cas2